MEKSADAFRTIGEVSDWLDTPAHVIRFWESRFEQINPVQKEGGRRYFRPDDVQILSGLKKLLHEDGLTIKAVQKMIEEDGIQSVKASVSEVLEGAPEIKENEKASPAETAPPTPGRRKRQKLGEMEAVVAQFGGEATPAEIKDSSEEDPEGAAEKSQETLNPEETVLSEDAAVAVDSTPPQDAETDDADTATHPDDNAPAASSDLGPLDKIVYEPSTAPFDREPVQMPLMLAGGPTPILEPSHRWHLNIPPNADNDKIQAVLDDLSDLRAELAGQIQD
ncbi:MAG: MerR family transcriptional regulator [Pseudomonadota bacterium]